MGNISVENSTGVVLAKSAGQKSKKDHPFRDTVPVRISRKLRDEAVGFKGGRLKTISKIVDEALTEFILALKRQLEN